MSKNNVLTQTLGGFDESPVENAPHKSPPVENAPLTHSIPHNVVQKKTINAILICFQKKIFLLSLTLFPQIFHDQHITNTLYIYIQCNTHIYIYIYIYLYEQIVIFLKVNIFIHFMHKLLQTVLLIIGRKPLCTLNQNFMLHCKDSC